MSRTLCSHKAFLYVRKKAQFHRVQHHIQLRQICQACQQLCAHGSDGHQIPTNRNTSYKFECSKICAISDLQMKMYAKVLIMLGTPTKLVLADKTKIMIRISINQSHTLIFR